MAAKKDEWAQVRASRIRDAVRPKGDGRPSPDKPSSLRTPHQAAHHPVTSADIGYSKLWLKRREWTLDEAAYIWCDAEPGAACDDATLGRIRAVRGLLDDAARHRRLPTTYLRGGEHSWMAGAPSRPESALVEDLEKFALSIGERPSFTDRDVRAEIDRSIDLNVTPEAKAHSDGCGPDRRKGGRRSARHLIPKIIADLYPDGVPTAVKSVELLLVVNAALKKSGHAAISERTLRRSLNDDAKRPN